MRHGNKINHLGRKYAHRSALLSNMATSLLMHKRIKTTIAKAKELRVYVEPIINRAKADTTHNRRNVFSELQSKEAVTELFNNIAGKIASRNGGYTRILKLGDNRVGDNAEMCYIELVDYNENMLKDAKTTTKKRTRRGKTTTKQTVKSEETKTETTEKETEDKE
ncbi:MAG: 50S ribosomal protein L17 [Chitinophagales bacterium]|nr:50S ribosomal protein L17 [Chitinophagales bacterium]